MRAMTTQSSWFWVLAGACLLSGCENSPTPLPRPPGWRSPPQKMAPQGATPLPTSQALEALTPKFRSAELSPAASDFDELEGQISPPNADLPLAAETLTRLLPIAAESLVHVVTWRTARSAPLFPAWGDKRAPFWDPFGGAIAREPERRHSEPASLGSGFLVTKDGWVVTNHHVVENADDIFVILASGERLRAECLGTDPPTDLAILRVEGAAESLPHLRLGDSGALQAGDFVMALGNPYGLGRSVSFGIVSATGRSGLGIVDVEDFVQTDAAIHPGNSGGPLLNLRGEVVGVNAAILSPSGAFAGIGFAIPSDILRFVMDEIERAGKVSRGYLGVTVQAVSPQLAAHLNSPSEHGVLVADLVENGPAIRNGVRRGDLILRLDGQEIARPAELRMRVATLGPGETVTLDVWRARKAVRLSVPLQMDPDSVEQDSRRTHPPDREPPPHWGLHFVATPRALQEGLAALDLPIGAVLRRMDENSPGAWAGMQVGDILLRVDEQNVLSPQNAEALLDDALDDALLLLHRDGHTFYILLEKAG